MLARHQQHRTAQGNHLAPSAAEPRAAASEPSLQVLRSPGTSTARSRGRGAPKPHLCLDEFLLRGDRTLGPFAPVIGVPVAALPPGAAFVLGVAFAFAPMYCAVRSSARPSSPRQTKSQEA